MHTLPKRGAALAFSTLALIAGSAIPAQAATYSPVVAHDDIATVEPGGTVRVDVLGNDEYDPIDTVVVQADGARDGWSFKSDDTAIEVTAPQVAAGQQSVLTFGYLVLGNETNSSAQVRVTAEADSAPVRDPDPVVDPEPDVDGDGPTEGTCPAGQTPAPGTISGCVDGEGSGYQVLCQHDYTVTRTVPGIGPARLGGGIYKGGTHSEVETYSHAVGSKVESDENACGSRFQHVGGMSTPGPNATAVLTQMLTGSENGGRLIGPVGLYRVVITPRMVQCEAVGDVLVSCGQPEVIAASQFAQRIRAGVAPTPETPTSRDTPDPTDTPAPDPTGNTPEPRMPPRIDAGGAFEPSADNSPPELDTEVPSLAAANERLDVATSYRPVAL